MQIAKEDKLSKKKRTFSAVGNKNYKKGEGGCQNT